MAIEIPNFLASYAGGLQLGQQMKQSRSQNALMDARRSYGRNALAAGGEFSPESYLQAYAADAARAGDFEALTSGQKAYGDFQKQKADIGKTQRETRNIDFAGLQKQLELQGQLLGSATDQASWDNALRIAGANGIDVSGVPPQYSPQTVSNLQQMTLTAQQRLDQMWKQRSHDMDVAKFDYQKRNDAANRAVQVRGQDKQDARARDASALKRQEIGLKDQQRDNDRREAAAATDIAIDTLSGLKSHPGLKSGTGSVVAPIWRNVPGTNARGFAARLEQFKSQTFLPAVQQMKGMGQLSNAEGAALQKAVGNLDPDMPTSEFNRQVDSIMAQMRAYRDRKYGDIPQTEWEGRQPAGATGNWGIKRLD